MKNMSNSSAWYQQLLWAASGDPEVNSPDSLADIERIRLSLERLRGEPCTTLEAYTFWEWRSREYDAGWLALPGRGELDDEVATWLKVLNDKTTSEESEGGEHE